jgi:dTDP-4-amino-4,6-dideoxygalactose transaminase
LQQGKHMSTGEGGMVVSSDPVISRRMQLFIDKAWGYGDPNPDHYFLALNYRMTELAGAVALAQFEKLPKMIEARVTMAKMLTSMIGDLPGVHAPEVSAHAQHTYWKYPLRIEPRTIAGGADAFGQKLKESGVFCAPRYIQKPAFECAVLRDRNTFGKSHFPYEGEHRRGDPPVIYDIKDTPGTAEGLATVVVLPWNEKYTAEHVEYIAQAIKDASKELTKKAS